MVHFYTYLFSPIHDRTLQILMLSLTSLIMPIDKVITQTIFVVLFTSGSLLHLGEALRCLIWCLPQVFVCYLLPINYIPFFTDTIWWPTMPSIHKVLIGGGRTSLCYGGTLTSAPHYSNFIFHLKSQLELSSLTSLKAWGTKKNSRTILPSC